MEESFLSYDFLTFPQYFTKMMTNAVMPLLSLSIFLKVISLSKSKPTSITSQGMANGQHQHTFMYCIFVVVA
jgi:hypothetical protein